MTVAPAASAVHDELPEVGQLVTVRGSKWIVTDVAAQALERSSADDGKAELQHAVSLQSIEEEHYGREMTAIWQLEPGRGVDSRPGPPPRSRPRSFRRSDHLRCLRRCPTLGCPDLGGRPDATSPVPQQRNHRGLPARAAPPCAGSTSSEPAPGRRRRSRQDRRSRTGGAGAPAPPPRPIRHHRVPGRPRHQVAGGDARQVRPGLRNRQLQHHA